MAIITEGTKKQDPAPEDRRKIPYAAWTSTQVVATPRSSPDVSIDSARANASTNSTRTLSSSRARRRIVMSRSVSFSAFGHATSLFLAISFVLCVAGDLVMPAHEMHTAWQRLLPGFEWISWGSFFLGLVESYVWGWYL